MCRGGGATTPLTSISTTMMQCSHLQIHCLFAQAAKDAEAALAAARLRHAAELAEQQESTEVAVRASADADAAKDVALGAMRDAEARAAAAKADAAFAGDARLAAEAASTASAAEAAAAKERAAAAEGDAANLRGKLLEARREANAAKEGRSLAVAERDSALAAREEVAAARDVAVAETAAAQRQLVRTRLISCADFWSTHVIFCWLVMTYMTNCACN